MLLQNQLPVATAYHSAIQSDTESVWPSLPTFGNDQFTNLQSKFTSFYFTILFQEFSEDRSEFEYRILDQTAKAKPMQLKRTDQQPSYRFDEKQKQTETLDAELGVPVARWRRKCGWAKQFGILRGERHLIGGMRNLLGERRYTFEFEITLEMMLVQQ